MANSASQIALLEAEPDLARFMTEEEEAAARAVSVPVVRLPNGGFDVSSTLAHSNAFGALILDGMLYSRHRVGAQAALRLLGPGDLLAVPGTWRSALLNETTLTAAAPTTLAMFGPELLLAARRWPRIMAGFHVRIAEQSERMAAQLTICQIPRVDDRLLATMWLLAESWGYVTSAGTRLPLTLTHDTLGSLVGARRPTVTLALGELVQRGAIVRQDGGWLLLEPPAEVTPPSPKPREHDVLIDEQRSVWEETESPSAARELAHEQLMTRVRRLRTEHIESRQQVRDRLAELTVLRTRAAEARQRIAEESLRERQAPS